MQQLNIHTFSHVYMVGISGSWPLLHTADKVKYFTWWTRKEEDICHCVVGAQVKLKPNSPSSGVTIYILYTC